MKITVESKESYDTTIILDVDPSDENDDIKKKIQGATREEVGGTMNGPIVQSPNSERLMRAIYDWEVAGINLTELETDKRVREILREQVNLLARQMRRMTVRIRDPPGKEPGWDAAPHFDTYELGN